MYVAWIRRSGWSVAALALWVGLAPCRADEPDAQADAADTNTSGAAAVLADFEAAGRAVETIHCGVVYSTRDALNETETTKLGTILFKRSSDNPMFLITFTKTVSDGIQFPANEWWLFRDRWLWEAKAKSSTIIKRELFAPGEKFDLFDLDKSPVPMPFGQTRHDVLAKFKVRLMPPQVGDPQNTDHLYCVPRPDSPLARDYRRLEYYIAKSTHLPVRIVAEDANQTKVTIAEFKDLSDGARSQEPLSAKSINVNIPDSAFKLPDETSGYHVSVEPLEERNRAGR